jgi:carbonic anhydrase/acetyltransferase-like protein (isoleucine patch superfamily)
MSGVILPYRGMLPKIDPEAFVASSAVIVGDVTIGPDTGIWYGCVVRGDVNDIRIGARTNIQDGTVIHVSSSLQGTYIGDDITIGHLALIHACTLESGCFIGMKACVMDGAVVESGAMVAAGALVTPNKRVRRGQLWAGSPARHLRDLSEEEMAGLTGTAHHYVDLAREYRRG